MAEYLFPNSDDDYDVTVDEYGNLTSTRRAPHLQDVSELVAPPAVAEEIQIGVTFIEDGQPVILLQVTMCHADPVTIALPIHSALALATGLIDTAEFAVG